MLVSIRNGDAVKLNLKNTLEEKPPYREHVLFWHPSGNGFWVVGALYQGTDEFGDYFQSYGFGGWYLCDGHVYWDRLPTKP